MYIVLTGFKMQERFVNETSILFLSTIAFETIIWDWDNNEKKRGKIIDIFYSGDSEIDALSNHFDYINRLNKDENADEKEGNQK